MKGVISVPLNNAAFDRAVLQAGCETQTSKWLVCFEKLSFFFSKAARARFAVFLNIPSGLLQ